MKKRDDIYLIIAVTMISIFTPRFGYSFSYKWREGSIDGTVSRCFSASDIDVHCEDFSEPKLGKKNVEELQINAKDLMGRKFFYSYEKGASGELCREHSLKIHKLLQNVKTACITGSVEMID